MYVRITQGRLVKGSWKEFEAIYKRVTAPDVAGLTGRFLLADVDSKDAGHSMSMWNSLEAMRAYEKSDLLKKVIEPALRPFYTDDFKTFVSEIVLQR
jgi:heme-degrading monooxygenase HmoA